ncbi:VanZ family protein [Paenibacillus campi]|uniref:VanZ family protein n=1 Tax=Paenibacillus campi TaxID=3106031 RepID=UPI002AFF32BB|nr:VanZ family protein [Paenibacillus sp. SGZ-1014]
MNKRLAICLVIGYTLLLLYWMFFGFGRHAPDEDTPYRYNLIPLRTIADFATMRIGTVMDQWINVLGNIAVFVPFGLFIPLVRSVRLLPFAGGFALFILLLEILQFITRRGTFDVDDIMLNTIGACLGYAGLHWILHLMAHKK